MARRDSIRRIAPWLIAASATAQQEVWQVDGIDRAVALGHALAKLPDLDGDGTPDLLAGVPTTQNGVSLGSARVLSGRDLSLLRSLDGNPGEDFGAAVADAGDVDADGVTDLFVGAPLAGAARVYSGATGVLLLQWLATDPLARLGASAVGLGDLDGDGHGDLAVGAPDEDVGGVRVGVVHVYSGASGNELRRHDGRDPLAHVGGLDRMANFGDLDGDGLDELALLDVDLFAGVPRGVARLLSGATGLELLSVAWNQGDYLDYLPSSIAGLGDVNSDGTRDFVVGSLPVDPISSGRAWLLSGANGNEILRIDLGDHPRWFFANVTPDADGDARNDLTISTTADAFSGPQPNLFLCSSANGATLGTLRGTPLSLFGRALLAGDDYDGDGVADFAVGDSSANLNALETGELRLARWPSGSLIARQFGDAQVERFNGAVTLLDDVDGDGFRDFAAQNRLTPNFLTESVRVISGRDGSELASNPVGEAADGALVALPDQDGDGHDDYAVGLSVQTLGPAVEVRGSASNSLLRRFSNGFGSMTGFGSVLAVGVQGSGAVELAIAAPLTNKSKNGIGEVTVVNLATGAVVFQKAGNWNGEQLGTSVAFLGDVNNDGVGDWAFGAPHNGSGGLDAGRVTIVSGVAGGQLKALFGVAGDRLGESVAAVGDLDGDGISELAVTALGAGGSMGEVRLFQGGSWLPVSTVAGSGANDRFGATLTPIADVNGDGIGEWIAAGSKPARLELRSGATAGILAKLRGSTATAQLAVAQEWQAASIDGDAIPDVIATDPSLAGGAGQAWLTVLDDLLLQFEPSVARSGATVFARLRGGPTGNVSGILLLDVNGAPVLRWLGIGTFDVFGAYFVVDLVPPGLAGTTMTLQGYGIGFGGSIVDSPEQTLHFE